MKKTILKTIPFLIVFLLISSCESNDDIFDATNEELLESSSKTNMIDELNEDGDLVIESTDSSHWRIISYEGTFIFQNGKSIPLVGTFINAEGYTPTRIGWKVTGSFSIIGEKGGPNVRVVRTSREAGTISYNWFDGTNLLTSRRSFIAIPPELPEKCPDVSHITMKAGDRLIYPEVYDPDFTYEWEVTNGDNTYNVAGRTASVPYGESIVTLTVTGIGCPGEVRRTKTFNFDPPPAGCPNSSNTQMQTNKINNTVRAKNYDSSFTYKWTVTNLSGNQTIHKTGPSVYIGRGVYTVTLTVSKAGCPTQTSTKDIFIDFCLRC